MLEAVEQFGQNAFAEGRAVIGGLLYILARDMGISISECDFPSL